MSLRSLRSRIILLALFACVLLVAAGSSFFFFLNSSQQARLDAAARHLDVLAAAMRSDYSAQLAHGASLQNVETPKPPPPPPPPPTPGAPPGPPGHPAESADAARDEVFSRITISVLRRESDVEGGFYSARANALVGYAFPTHEGPGGQREIPGKERPAIEELARAAAGTGVLQQQSFHGAYDGILLVAIPVQDGKQTVGAAWLMQRMPGLEAGRSKQLLLGSVGFAAAALTCVLLTFFITSEVRSGVQTVLGRLGTMEGSLGSRATENSRVELDEFEQVLERVDELSQSLKEKIERERVLEDEVRHRQRLSALGQFAAGVAHELRNPLATIRLRTQMSLRTGEVGAVERNCAVVLDEVTHLDSMIERLLYFSRPIHLQLKPVPTDQLCAQTLETWAARCAGAGVSLSCNGQGALTVLCDAGKVRQVIDNVMENALQSLAASARVDGRIEVVCCERGARVALEVRDNGDGLRADAAAHALEPFFTTKDAGTGLGLSISYEIMQAHGGDLQVNNQPGGGAVATLTLPQATSTLETP